MNPPTLMMIDLLLAEVAADVPASEFGAGAVVLAFLVVAVGVLARSLANLRAELEVLRESLKPKPRVAQPPPAPLLGPTPEEIAVITAAVHCVFGSNARLVSVDPDVSDWQVWSRKAGVRFSNLTGSVSSNSLLL